MDITIIVPLLSLIMLLGVLVFVVVSTSRFEEQRRDPKAQKASGSNDSRTSGHLERTSRRPFN